MSGGNDSWREKWHRFLNYTPEDRKLILRAAVILPLTEIGLRIFGFRRWKELVERLSPPRDQAQFLPAGLRRAVALRTVRAVRAAERHGATRPNCLERSLTLWWMLRQSAVDGELLIGARKQEGKFEAHAWVELEGQVLNDGPEVHEHYARFDAPIAAALSRPGAGDEAASK